MSIFYEITLNISKYNNSGSEIIPSILTIYTFIKELSFGDDFFEDLLIALHLEALNIGKKFLNNSTLLKATLLNPKYKVIYDELIYTFDNMILEIPIKQLKEELDKEIAQVQVEEVYPKNYIKKMI